MQLGKPAIGNPQLTTQCISTCESFYTQWRQTDQFSTAAAAAAFNN